MLLLVPEDRELFVTLDDVNQRYFSIEHYFSDEVLMKYNMCGKRILHTPVFEINGDKNGFSKEIKELNARDFENFKILFEEIEKVLKNTNEIKLS